MHCHTGYREAVLMREYLFPANREVSRSSPASEHYFDGSGAAES
jgi:hypothetical protein